MLVNRQKKSQTVHLYSMVYPKSCNLRFDKFCFPYPFTLILTCVCTNKARKKINVVVMRLFLKAKLIPNIEIYPGKTSVIQTTAADLYNFPHILLQIWNAAPTVFLKSTCISYFHSLPGQSRRNKSLSVAADTCMF